MMQRFDKLSRHGSVIGLVIPSALLLVALLVVPLSQMLTMSFRTQRLGQVQPGFTTENYQQVLTSGRYFEIFLTTFGIAALVTLLCVAIGYPVAIHLVRAKAPIRTLLYFAVAAPLIVNTVVRSYGWLLLLGNAGLVNIVLMGVGLTDEPVRLSGNLLGLVIAATQVFLPFMILALAASLQTISPAVSEASDLLGASAWQRFWTVTFPLSRPGLIAGSILVFALMLGAFVTPLIVGGSAIPYLSVAVYTDALVLFNLPRATALSVILLLIVVLLFATQNKVAAERETA